MSHNQQPASNGFETGLRPPQINDPEITPFYEIDKPQDECGVFAIYAPGEPVCQLTYQGMKALQHRGQSAAGLALYDDHGLGIEGSKQMMAYKGIGLVEEAIGHEIVPRQNGESRADLISSSKVAIGHTRYSTSASEDLAAVHPFLRGFALASNGHTELEMMLPVAKEYGIDLASVVTDTAGLADIIEAATKVHDGDIMAALAAVLPAINGAYNLVIATEACIYAARDPWGFHPFALGQLPDGKGHVVASEPVAFKAVGAEYVRDLKPGEIMEISQNGVRSTMIARNEKPQYCSFEYIYTARADGIINGVSVYKARKNLGRALGLDAPAEVDVVIGVPTSGLTAASGYSEAIDCPRVDGILKNPYIARTFIARGNNQALSLEEKFQIITDEIAGKRVALVDDSIIKSNTMKQLVKMIWDAGATEVHVRSSAPHYLYPCYMGMDTGDLSQLVARRMSDAEISELIGATSVAFNTTQRLREAVDDARVDKMAASVGDKLCTACMTGEYPLPVPVTAYEPIELSRRHKAVHIGSPALAAASAS